MNPVTGPQHGAGTSVQRGDDLDRREAHTDRHGPLEASLAVKDGSRRVDGVGGRDAQEHVRCCRVPDGGRRRHHPFRRSGQNRHPQASACAGCVVHASRTVRNFSGVPVSNSTGPIVSCPVDRAMNRSVGVVVGHGDQGGVAGHRRRETGAADPGDKHQDQQPCKTAKARRAPETTVPSVGEQRRVRSPGRPWKLNANAGHSFTARNRSALAMTDTELKDIASAATTGLSRIPNSG